MAQTVYCGGQRARSRFIVPMVAKILPDRPIAESMARRMAARSRIMQRLSGNSASGFVQDHVVYADFAGNGTCGLMRGQRHHHCRGNWLSITPLAATGTTNKKAAAEDRGKRRAHCRNDVPRPPHTGGAL